MKIVYFASLRRQIGVAEEVIDLPGEIDRVDHLIDWLKQRSPAHRAALDACGRVLVAIDQDYARYDQRLAGAAEVALFPPVTGGTK